MFVEVGSQGSELPRETGKKNNPVCLRNDVTFVTVHDTQTVVS